MLKKSNIPFVFLGFFSAMLISCRERGCKDWDAENFEPKASISCSCCYYYGKIRVIYDYTYYDKKLRFTGNYLQIYINKVLVKQTTKDLKDLNKSSANSYAYSHMTPENDNVIVVGEDLGDQKIKEVYVEVIAANGNVLWEGNASFKANSITPIELK